MRSVRRPMCAAILTLEAVVLGLTTPVLVTIAGVQLGTALWVGLGLAAVCLLTTGLLRFEWAYWVGWAVQVAAIALGVVIPMMVVLGVVFASLWAAAYFLGIRIDREKAERAVLEAEWERDHPAR